MAKIRAVARRRSLRSVQSESSHSSQATVSQLYLPGIPPQETADKLVKQLLKSFKKLELAAGKFASKLGITKTNILRTTLLPFLRLQPLLDSVLSPSSKLYDSFCSISTTVLGKWWRLLLAVLVSQNQVTSTDRNAYLECVSRILARREWACGDAELLDSYRVYLTSTLDYCISRLQALKVVPISMSAFVGKVFAYAYFYLPHVCNALLFLLNVKQSVVDSHLATLPRIPSQEIFVAQAAFPQTVSHLVDYRGLTDLLRQQRAAINSIVPPLKPVKGIRDPGGPWVRRWSSCDSDIFNSFFRHYITLCDVFLSGKTVLPAAFPGFHIIASHTYQIFAVLVTRILISLACKPSVPAKSLPPISKSRASGHPSQSPAVPAKNNSAPNGSTPPPPTSPNAASGATSNASLGTPLFNQTDTNYACIIKIFKTIRDISYSSISFASTLTRFIDLLLVNVARTISIYDFNKNGLLLNLVHEYSNHVFDASSMHWEFWLGCSYLMLSTHHVQIIMRNFAFLFNVWDHIPDHLPLTEYPEKIPHLRNWLTNPNESYKQNFSMWLTSTDVWSHFFTHWNPIVRSYYSRLLVWRVIGINNYESSSSIQTTRRVKNKLDAVFNTVCKELAALNEDSSFSLTTMNFVPDHPMVNRKFSIVANSKFAFLGDDLSALLAVSMRPSELRKTHPYEIFDEAIYTCTSLPSSPALHVNTSPQDLPKNTKNHNLINSLSRFFKILSTEESNEFPMVPPNQILSDRLDNSLLQSKRNSKSLSSLSTAPSMKSRSSSPSLMSFQSSLHSNADFSADSSVASDSDSSSLVSDCIGSSSSSSYSSSSSTAQPPELFKVPPEIVRPIFKFDIVMDQESLCEKYHMMQNANTAGKFFPHVKASNASLAAVPKSPKIPSVSIFLNSDIYNKFYITTENYMVEEDIYSDSERVEINRFNRALSKSIVSSSTWLNLGKSLNEWNSVVEEFERYLFNKVEADQENYIPVATDGEDATRVEIDEADYFTRIVPYLPIDNLTELKLLNAS